MQPDLLTQSVCAFVDKHGTDYGYYPTPIEGLGVMFSHKPTSTSGDVHFFCEYWDVLQHVFQQPAVNPTAKSISTPDSRSSDTFNH